jgi:hypothetical protein
MWTYPLLAVAGVALLAIGLLIRRRPSRTDRLEQAFNRARTQRLTANGSRREA